jgi:hypothetical protein
MQTLDIGAMTKRKSGISLAMSMSGTFQGGASMIAPAPSGVKVIPYITQGRGDAMMMNWIFGGDLELDGVLPVFDGIDMPIEKIFEYAEGINEAVNKNWEADVLGDVIADIERFLDATENDGQMLRDAWAVARLNATEKKSRAKALKPEDLLSELYEMHRLNKARKAVFKRIGISVDHMGGSDTAFTKGPDGLVLTLDQINEMIQEELLRPGSTEESVVETTETLQIEQQKLIENTEKREPKEGEFSKLEVTDAETVFKAFIKQVKNPDVRAAARIIQRAGITSRVVMGSPEEVKAWYEQNVGPLGNQTLQQDRKGMYDPVNDIILLIGNNPETILHEMIHAATFKIVQEFYEGDQKHADTMARLEKLSEEFMSLDFAKAPEDVRSSAAAAQSAIIQLQAKDDAFSKAAALNEFMAWTLSNEGLINALKGEKTTVWKKLGKQLKALMVRLLGGVKKDMLSNIQFNTALLLNEGQPQVPGDNGNRNDPPPPGDNNVTPSAAANTNFWIELASARIGEARADPTRARERVGQVRRYLRNANNALEVLDLGGFSMDAYQKKTFKAIHMIMAMETRLDANSAAALNKLFTHVTDNLDPAMFGTVNNQSRYSAVMDIFGGSKNDDGVSDAIAVLLALSQTSQGFRNAIDQLPVPESDQNLDTDSLNSALSSITWKMMNKAVGTIDVSNKALSETLDDLAGSILIEESEQEFRALAGMMNGLNKGDETIMNALKKSAGWIADKNVNIQNDERRGKLAKVAANSVTMVASFVDQERSQILADGLVKLTHMGQNLDNLVFAREFLVEMVGTDESNRGLVAQLDDATYATSSVRQQFREELPVILSKAFEKTPDETQWKAFHQVLGKADFAAMFDQANPDVAFNLLKDASALDQAVVAQEAAIAANFSQAEARLINIKSMQLADFMNGKGAGYQLWRNAHAITKMSGEMKENMVPEVDRLISLYAMKRLDPAKKAEVVRSYEDDPKAMVNLAVYLKGLNKEEDLKEISEDARMNGYKGYIPDVGRPGMKMIIANDREQADLEKKGYKRVADATADSEWSAFDRGYYVTSTKQTGTYSQGVMQLIQDTYRGVDATTGLSINGQTSGLIQGAAVETITNGLNTSTQVMDNKETLLPVFDEDGGVLYYERALNPDLIEKYTEPKSNLALMMGHWAGRQVEEKTAQQYNNALIDELKRIYDEREAGDDSLFINLPEEAMKMQAWNDASRAERRTMTKPDQVYLESWNVISPQTKAQIQAVFGENMFFVKKAQMNIALGYRDPSIIDVWTGNTRVPDGMREGIQAITEIFMKKNAMKWLAGVEGAVQGVVSTAKDLIVVRSLVVPYMNTQANVVQLSTRGIPVKRQYEGYKRKLAEIEQYNENRKRIIQLDAEIQFAGTDANRVRILEGQKQTILDQNKRFSVAPLIDAGQYKNISEGITEQDLTDITSGRLGEWVEERLNKLPMGVQTIAKYGVLSKDTALYQGANKAVQYGDFIAKSIYYDHLMESKGMSSEDAMKLVNEEFVNFSVLPGRTRQYLEGMGATWFLSFKIRIMKIAMNQARENPLRSMILAATIADFGSPQADNLASVIVDDRIGYALGWEMLWGSAGLNPWVNIYD